MKKRQKKIKIEEKPALTCGQEKYYKIKLIKSEDEKYRKALHIVLWSGSVEYLDDEVLLVNEKAVDELKKNNLEYLLCDNLKIEGKSKNENLNK